MPLRLRPGAPTWLVSFAFSSPVLFAGDYHDGVTLDCAQCHVMHPTPATSVGEANEWSDWGGRVSPDLLRKDVNDLCLSCHDDSSRFSDVLGANRGKDPGAVRQAGFLNRLGVVGHPGTGHTLDSLDAAPGSEPAWRPEDEGGPGQGLNCVHCHAPHGSRYEPTPTYRNLRSDAGKNLLGAGTVTYNHDRPGSNDLSRDVFVRRALDYDESAVDFNEPEDRDSAVGRFCAGCHGGFHGSPGSRAIGGREEGPSYVEFLRHPDAGVDIGAAAGPSAPGSFASSALRYAGHANRVKVMSEIGVWSAPGADLTPTCITCHKAHGNNNAFGLILRSGRGALSEDGDAGGGTLEHLCGQCHGEGSVFAAR